MGILANAMYSLGLILAMATVVYWCYALRIVVEKEAKLSMKLFFVGMMVLFPLFTPAIIYLLYPNVIKESFWPKSQNAQ